MEELDVLATSWYSEKPHRQLTSDRLHLAPNASLTLMGVGARTSPSRLDSAAHRSPSQIPITSAPGTAPGHTLREPSLLLLSHDPGPCADIHGLCVVDHRLPLCIPASELPLRPHLSLTSCFLSAHPCLCLPLSLSVIFSSQKGTMFETDLQNIPFQPSMPHLTDEEGHIYDVIVLLSKYSTCIF